MQPGLVERVMMLRASLSPEKELMGPLLYNVSRTWKAEQVVAEAGEHGTREFRVTQMHRGVALHDFLVETWSFFTQSELWQLLVSTESLRYAFEVHDETCSDCVPASGGACSTLPIQAVWLIGRRERP